MSLQSTLIFLGCFEKNYSQAQPKPYEKISIGLAFNEISREDNSTPFITSLTILKKIYGKKDFNFFMKNTCVSKMGNWSPGGGNKGGPLLSFMPFTNIILLNLL